MEIVANEKGIERRSNIGRAAGLASLIILGAALILSFTEIVPPLIMPLVLAVVLTTGVLFSIVGGYYAERYGGPHAHHRGVRSALKGLGNRFILFQYVLPVPHVLLGPDGLTAIVVRSHTGTVTFANGKWSHRQKGKFFRELAGQERVGRPDEEAELMVERLTRLLHKRLPDIEVPVRGAVLFIHPDLQLELEDEPPVPVFYGKKLKAWLRGPGGGKELPRPVWQGVRDELAGRFVGQID